MRKAMAFPVRFVAEGQSVQSTSRDLDEDSVFVRCVEPPRLGDQVVLRLYLPGIAAGDSIHAEVVESGGEGFRARFVDIADEAREHIASALRKGSAAVAALDVEPLRPGENRRFLPRYLDRFRVTLNVGKHRAQREALNLSASGMFIETDAPPAVDQIVHVILELRDGKPPLEVQGIVLHRVVAGTAATPGVGVQFIAADDSFRARLDAYLDKLRNR
ncbi:MAG: PilZ domain-containing protein [Myxococcales bacterium]